MGMKFRNRLKKILTEALIVGLLFMSAAMPSTDAGAAGSLMGETDVGSEQPGAGNGEDDDMMPCGDLVDEDDIQIIAE